MNKDYLRLNYNENSYVKQYFKDITENAIDITCYPSVEFEEFRQRMANMYNVNQKNIYFGNGIDELILTITIMFSSEGDEIIVPEETFRGYEHSANILRRKVVFAKLEDYKISVSNIITKITEKTKVIFICNPHNPTGSVVSKKDIKKLIHVCEENNILFVLDEAYYEFCGDKENWYQHSIGLEHFVVLRTFSKFYGSAGLRMGYAISNQKNIEKIAKMKDALPFNINVVAQGYSFQILNAISKNEDKILSFYDRIRQYFYEALDNLHLFYVKSYTNFVLVKIGVDADEFCSIMKEQYHILLKSGSEWGLNNFVRISLCGEDDCDYLFLCMKKVFKKMYETIS